MLNFLILLLNVINIKNKKMTSKKSLICDATFYVASGKKSQKG